MIFTRLGRLRSNKTPGEEADLRTIPTRAAFAAVAAIATTATADAADLPRAYTAPAPISAYSWTGPYLGGHLGFEWGRTTRNPTRPSGIAGGVAGGYNWQTGQFVFGIEADVTAAAAHDTFAPWKFANPWFGTLRGRVGYALDRVLVYATAGLALGSLEANVTGATERRTNAGWTVGGGVEVGITPAWSARVEYLFVDLSDRSYAVTGLGHGFEANLLRLGVQYRF
jgi:outer membrane immunogenic protein